MKYTVQVISGTTDKAKQMFYGLFETEAERDEFFNRLHEVAVAIRHDMDNNKIKTA